jgi:hypothetical protein
MMFYATPCGDYWCPSCFARRPFVVAAGESDEDPECAIECVECGYVHGKLVEEFDPATGVRHTNPIYKSAIPREVRDEARAKLRGDFRRSALSDGARLENFTMTRRKRV